MAAAPNIIDASATYIRIESVANIFATLSSFALVALVTLGREQWLYVLTGFRLVLSVVFDSLLISNLPFSLQLGVNGIGWSNLAANGILFIVALFLDVAINTEMLRQKVRNYALLTASICGLWVISIPGWKPFMSSILGYADVDQLFQLVLLLLGFYVVYSFQSLAHAIFLGLGKTNYILVQSLITNAVYYGGAFLLYRVGIWTPTLTSIAMLFGWGMVFGGVVTSILYWWLLQSRKRLVTQ